MMICPTCHGQMHTGQIIRVIEYVGGTRAELFKTCATCGGMGKIADVEPPCDVEISDDEKLPND